MCACYDYATTRARRNDFRLSTIQYPQIFDKPQANFTKVKFGNYWRAGIGRIRILFGSDLMNCLIVGDHPLSDFALGKMHGSECQSPCTIAVNTEPGKSGGWAAFARDKYLSMFRTDVLKFEGQIMNCEGPVQACRRSSVFHFLISNFPLSLAANYFGVFQRN
jgi:hypothetical protein